MVPQSILEIETALKTMKMGKARGPDEVTVDMIGGAGAVGVQCCIEQ